MIWNSQRWYGSVARWLHWIIGIAFILMVIVGLLMGDAPVSIRPTIVMLHKSTGVVLLVAVALRLVWRLMNVQPVPSPHVPEWQNRAASLNIGLLYILMFTMPLTGFLMSYLGKYGINFYGLFTIGPWGKPQPIAGYFHDIHVIAPYVLIAAFVAHVAGAINHHFIVKDDTLRRMLRSES